MPIKNRTLYLLVTCSLDDSRSMIAQQVVENIVDCVKRRPEMSELVVFDNASIAAAQQQLVQTFDTVFAANRNVGLWSAIDWSLKNIIDDHEFIYIIESDMIHFAPEKISLAELAMDKHQNIGCVRCQEYSVAERKLYDKDAPVRESRRWAWQSHRHRFTGEQIEHVASAISGVYLSNFLAVLPGLNRVSTMRAVFQTLSRLEHFSESDFQHQMWLRHPTNAFIDGGTFHSRLGSEGVALTGSWSNKKQLASIGYRQTRIDRIEHVETYDVQRLMSKHRAICT